MNRTGYITPSRFKDVMTKARGYKTPEELEVEFRQLKEDQAKREAKGTTTTKVYADSKARLEELPRLIKYPNPAAQFGETAKSYAVEVALGRFGIEKPQVNAKSLEHGNQYEPEARAAYEEATGNSFPVQNVRTVSEEFPFIAGECDGIIYRADGRPWGGEIKCPHNPINHWMNISEGKQFEEDYKWQVAGYCRMYDWEGYTAVSYSPFFPGQGKLWHQDYERDNDLEIELFETLVAFNEHLVAPLVLEMLEAFKVNPAAMLEKWMPVMEGGEEV